MSARPPRKPTLPLRDFSWRLGAALLLGFAGMVIAARLVFIHLALQADPDAGSACNLGGYFNCDIVNASRFASVGDVPIAYGALALYALLTSLAFHELRGSDVRRVVVYSRILGTLAVLYSAYLAVLSVAILHAFCVFCVGLYAVNIGFAALGWLRPPPQLRVADTLRLDALVFFTAGSGAWQARAAVLLALLGASGTRQLGLVGRARSVDTPLSTPVQRSHVAIAAGHSEGAADSRVVVVEFSDFECPHCRKASADFEALRARFAGQVQFVFKHFPLDTRCNTSVRRRLHKRACAAADAAICAGEQHRLWSFQKETFARGAVDAKLVEAADAAGLDVAAWQRCRWTDAAREAVVRDVEDGIRLGITKTPSFLVGDRLLTGARSRAELSDEIVRQLAEDPPLVHHGINSSGHRRGRVNSRHAAPPSFSRNSESIDRRARRPLSIRARTRVPAWKLPAAVGSRTEKTQRWIGSKNCS